MTTRRALLSRCSCVAAAALVAHSLVFNFVTDDAFISFVFSRNLAEHGQLVFNLGEPVEGYTNFLWTVVLGALMKLGHPAGDHRRACSAPRCALGTLADVRAFARSWTRADERDGRRGTRCRR